MIQFFVAGDPATQGSKRIVQPKGHRRPRLLEVTSKRLAPWRTATEAEAFIARQRLGRTLVEPVAVALAFYCTRPKRPRRPYPRLDLDKLVRAVGDGLMRGSLLRDDSQIVALTATKEWSTTRSGCQVMVKAATLALVAVLLGAAAVAAETLRLTTEERHIAIGDVVAHVGVDGATYAIDHGVVVPLASADVRITDRRARLTLPDRTLECPLPVEALQEERGRLQSRQGRAVRVREIFRRRTWLVACPDGPGVIWDAFDRTTITTKGP